MIFGRCRPFINKQSKINTEQPRSLKGFLHVIQILFESDLLCDRCTVQTAAALRVNTVNAPSDVSHTVDPHQSGAPSKAVRRLKLNFKVQFKNLCLVKTTETKL